MSLPNPDRTMTNFFRMMALSMIAIGTLAAAGPVNRSEEHFALRKSAPEEGASVESPAEVRLWFTEEPQEGTTSIQVAGADEAGVHVADVMQDSADPLSFGVELHGTLPPGTHTVAWRGMGSDGHAVRETFDFTVVAR